MIQGQSIRLFIFPIPKIVAKVFGPNPAVARTASQIAYSKT